MARGKRGKGAAKTETPPATRKPSDAPEAGGVTKSTLCDSVSQLRKLEKDKDDSVKTLRDQRKLMKGQGVDLEVMDWARKFQKFDEATRMLKLQTLGRYLQWLNLMASGDSPDLFNSAGPALSNDDKDIADHKGRMAARKFATADDNPYSPDEENFDIWEFARKDEMKEVEREMKEGNGSKGQKADATAEAAAVH